MKINVDAKNRRVIASGSFAGKRIKVIAKCNEESFDREFGKSLAEKKFKIKTEEVKRDMHNRYIKDLYNQINWCEQQISYERGIVNSLNEKIKYKKSECEDFVNSYFNC